MNLSNNYLSDLPMEIGTLSHLEILGLSKNRLSMLPVSIGLLTKLKILDVADNKLTHLPISLASLHSLKELYLEYNAPSLYTSLGVDYQYFEKDTPTISASKAAAEYVKQLSQGTTLCLRMKVMFLGEEGVGKTTLLGRLAKRLTRVKTLAAFGK